MQKISKNRMLFNSNRSTTYSVYTSFKVLSQEIKSVSRLAGLFIFVALGVCAKAQPIIITGKVTDGKTGEPLPYVSVSAKGTKTTTTTNFDGIYTLALPSKVDSIKAGFVGYLRATKAIGNASNQQINIQLFPLATQLGEVVVTRKGYVNPAWEILRQVVNNKTKNDFRSLSAFQYQSYNRIELDATKLDEKLKKKKFIRELLPLMDSLKKVAGEGEPILPLFVSESISDYFYQQNPEKKRENILRTKINGVGFEDGTMVSQLVGSTFQQHNFYKNYLGVAGKDFISPIASTWRLSYDYELEERYAKIGNQTCYKISFKPKRDKDLAFNGTMWIAHDSYALCQIVATIEPSANLNFIEKVKLQQESAPAERDGAWLPVKTRISVELSQLSKGTAGFLAKFYTSNKDIKINRTYDPHFFDEAIVVSDDVEKKDENFWNQNRHDSLTVSEKHVFAMIDTVKNVPAIKTYIDVIDMLISGYYKAGKVGIGPYIFTYAHNDVEGSRIRLGFKTNSDFSNRWILSGYGAYGTADEKFKFGASADYILSRKPWTQAGASFSHDLNQVSLLNESFSYVKNNLFTAVTRFGKMSRRRVFVQDMTNLYIQRDLFKNFTQKATLSHWTFDPLYPFQYYSQTDRAIHHNFATTELQLESKWTPGIHVLQSEKRNRPVMIKGERSYPAITFRYTHGFKGLLDSDLEYDKFSLNITQKIKLGLLGRGTYSITGGYIPSTVPYPILENHLGNSTVLYNPNAYNQMRFFEFVSDRYVGLQYTQNFEGLLINSIPLLRDLNCRLVGTTNILFGSLSNKNIETIPRTAVLETRGLNPAIPYVEVGYGLENIFKFLRVDVIHRLTYLDNRNPQRVGLRFSAQIKL